MNEAYNMDCMEGMKKYPDKHFFLAVCDPPYGINRFKNGETSRLRKYGSFQTVNDMRLTKEMFDEICRVSEHQIVWGYNHLSDVLPPCSEFVFWYKHQPVDTYADGELAYTSFGKTAKCFDFPFFGGTGADKDSRIHPTQKPVALYTWLFTKYAKNGGGRSSTRFWVQAAAELQHMTQDLILSDLKLTRLILRSKKNAITIIRPNKIYS